MLWQEQQEVTVLINYIILNYELNQKAISFFETLNEHSCRHVLQNDESIIHYQLSIINCPIAIGFDLRIFAKIPFYER